eukprot:548662-Alexandrium_andersonii.AAC.1
MQFVAGEEPGIPRAILDRAMAPRHPSLSFESHPLLPYLGGAPRLSCERALRVTDGSGPLLQKWR